MRKILLLGVSGSIGRQSLDIIEQYPDKFSLVAFSVGKRSEVIPEILKKHKDVKHVYLISDKKAKELAKEFKGVKFYSGKDGLRKITSVSNYDMCVDALVGFAGMEPAVITLERNKILCLANKEALVAGGTLINKLLDEGKGKLYPVDSEHVALAKCLSKCRKEDVKKLIITASGGALRNVPLNKLNEQKAADALKHPTWKMGDKITIDCATMMNKGFEIIEAFYLYHFPLSKIEVIMHDESLVHSMVELNDGSLLVDYGKPDMHGPIAYAMFESNIYFEVKHIKSLDELKDCHFHKYDAKRYPCTELAKKCLSLGASKMIALNASNEVAVNKYLKNKINFLDIARIVEEVVENQKILLNPSLDEIKEIDKVSRKAAEACQ